MLKVENLNVYYGMIHAIKDISLEVHKGEIVSLVGANGAGKTTTLHAISGLLKPKSGSATYLEHNLLTTPAHKIVEHGLSHVPEGRRVFSQMSVMENLEMGAYISKDKAKNKKNLDNVFQHFPRLEERKRQLAGTLSGGEQQMLAIGRAMMTSPEMLLLDEPSMGLSPLLVKEIFKIIKELNDDGITILLVEQNAKQALSIAHRGYVLETGKIVLSGNAAELLENDAVKKAYLGG
ncbi:MAG: ABC transporter ATP-binding protein [Peptococcaceae bacterium]|nr:ABC transporter ATP-binding protein [Peptococcaceae bacterium]